MIFNTTMKKINFWFLAQFPSKNYNSFKNSFIKKQNPIFAICFLISKIYNSIIFVVTAN